VKIFPSLQPLGFLCASLLMGGCLIKPSTVPTRQFTLAPMPAPEHAAAAAPPVFAEVEFVRMPSYLLRHSMLIRRSATEIGYLETAFWAQPLDQSFRQTLAQNLFLLLAEDQADTSGSGRNQARVKVSVNVEQFDVDNQGRGTLRAEWRLTNGGSDKPIKSGHTRLDLSAATPGGNPQAIATTLSALTAEFSRELAAVLVETTQVK